MTNSSFIFPNVDCEAIRAGIALKLGRLIIIIIIIIIIIANIYEAPLTQKGSLGAVQLRGFR